MMQYLIERDNDGVPEWWYSASEGNGSGWRTNIREATVYSGHRNANIAAHALHRWHKFKFPIVVIAYHISPVVSLGHWKETDGVVIRKRQ